MTFPNGGSRDENHPARGVSREKYVDAVNLNGSRPVGQQPMVNAIHRTEGAHGPVTHHYFRPANQGPTAEGGPLETAAYISDPNYRGRPMSKPNPGNLSPDEISNILRNSGP